MKRNISKVTLWGVVLLMFFALTNITLASEDTDPIYKLLFAELRISAVATDMHLYLGWLRNEKGMMRGASQIALHDLDDIKQDLVKLRLPDDLINLKDTNLWVIDKLWEIYNVIEDKNTRDIEREFEELNNVRSQYSEELGKILENRGIERAPRILNTVEEEIKSIRNRKDKADYYRAQRFIKDKRFSAAYAILNKLKDKYKNTPTEDCVMLKISDCLLMDNKNAGEEKRKEQLEEGLEILLRITEKNRYSPVLYEAFYKWRTITQMYYHGMSNTSAIPNKAYNQKRREIFRVLERHLQSNPKDEWTRNQIKFLVTLPNITRGGAIGNFNIDDIGFLYGTTLM